MHDLYNAHLYWRRSGIRTGAGRRIYRRRAGYAGWSASAIWRTDSGGGAMRPVGADTTRGRSTPDPFCRRIPIGNAGIWDTMPSPVNTPLSFHELRTSTYWWPGATRAWRYRQKAGMIFSHRRRSGNPAAAVACCVVASKHAATGFICQLAYEELALEAGEWRRPSVA